MSRCTILVILLIGTFGSLTSFGQMPFVVTPSVPDPGDTLFYQVDELPKRISITAPGRDQVWNFASLLGPYLQYQVAQSTSGNDASLQISGEQGTKYSYSEESMTLFLKSANRLKIGDTEIRSHWSSAEGLPMPSADIDYQDNHEYSALFQTTLSLAESPPNWRSSLPSGTDSIRISVLIDRSLTVDATGILFLVNGYRQETERIRVEDHLTKKIWAKKINGNWQDVTSLTRLEDLQPEDNLSYHFVSLETGGNICTVFLDKNGSPQSVQFVIPNDQARFFKPAGNPQWVLAYPNPALSYVRFKFIDLPPGDYTLKFYDVFMRNLFEKKYNITSGETVEINISHLNKGPYLYSLIDKSGKKITTKRLFVIKP